MSDPEFPYIDSKDLLTPSAELTLLLEPLLALQKTLDSGVAFTALLPEVSSHAKALAEAIGERTVFVVGSQTIDLFMAQDGTIFEAVPIDGQWAGKYKEIAYFGFYDSTPLLGVLLTIGADEPAHANDESSLDHLLFAPLVSSAFVV